MDQIVVYKTHRIHTSLLTSGQWLSMIVTLGGRKLPTHDALTDTVTRVPGEYPTKEEALQAAQRYIDEKESPRQE